MTIHDVEVLLPNLVSLGWLALLGVVFWGFRQPLREMLGRLRRGKVAGVEIELDAVSKEIAKLEIVQPLPLPQVVTALALPSSDAQAENMPDTDEFGEFVAVLIEHASRAPQAALIRLRIEVERRMGELEPLLHDPRVMAGIKQMAGDVAIEQFNVLTPHIRETINRYLSLHRRLLLLPASDERVRALMFVQIDAGVMALETMETTRSLLDRLSQASQDS